MKCKKYRNLSTFCVMLSCIYYYELFPMYLNNIGNDIDALEMCMNVSYELMLRICIFPMYLNNIGKDMGNLYEFQMLN